MGNDRRVRRLTVGDDVWLWSLRHGHRDGTCHKALSLTREGTGVRLRIEFRDGPGRIVSGGYWDAGSVGVRGGDWLNLHEPGAVRQLLDEALAAGFTAPAEIDGWQLFDALVGRTAAASGPAAGTAQ
ncbi:hypothetical protein [Streptomyces sp. NPDC002133]|uniref:hypothetical protein n=1 Tax=Streptomyces sp. NPDC002133 TaxID=3154409 RepID=UPI003328A038